MYTQELRLRTEKELLNTEKNISIIQKMFWKTTVSSYWGVPTFGGYPTCSPAKMSVD